MTTYAQAVDRLRTLLTPEALARVGAVYAFHFEDGTTATLDGAADHPRGYVEEPPAALGRAPNFEVTLTRDDFARLITGELHPMAGMATGRMRLRGSMRRAIELDRLLKERPSHPGRGVR